MGYLVAWGLYLLMAALLVAGFERYLAGYVTDARWRVLLRGLLAVGLFTPGLVAADDQVYLVPACIAVLFNILAHSWMGVVKSSLPLFLAGVLVFAVLALREALRKDVAGDA